mmetsp:Transcript_25803/g.56119  ORF Transcript_25803/g.56119 Transcript_25803/m.56119 type:complete len:248 (+) Transcript_25803:39-782(+)
MFHSYLKATSKPKNTGPLVGGVSLTAALFGQTEAPTQDRGQEEKKSKKAKKDKKAKVKKDKVKKSKKSKKGKKSKKSSSSSASSSSSSKPSSAQSPKEKAKEKRVKKLKTGEIIKIAPKQAVIDEAPKKYFLPPAEAKKQETLARQRNELAERRAMRKVEEEKKAKREEEAWLREAWRDKSPVRAQAKAMLAAEPSKPEVDEAEISARPKTIPLRAICRQKAVAWIWIKEKQAYIGGGQDGSEETLS